MTILAIEFSSAQRSVAILQQTVGLVSEVIETGAAGTQAFGMIDAALHEARIEREQVECLVVGLGPGSYTGIRAALALAQGWQLARGVKTLGVSSAECIAAQAQAEGVTGPFAVVIDAQRNEYYLADYEIDSGGLWPARPLRLVTRAEVLEQQQAGYVLLGPDIPAGFDRARQLFPRAATLAKLAQSRTDFVSSDKLEPIYLRDTKFVKAPPPRVLPK
jgi:tRNA threonylcarbamoyl adenosine modification protein YeaZ